MENVAVVFYGIFFYGKKESGGLNMKEIVTVTAFFDIGRGNFTEYTRSAEQYIEYFRFWAGIKNRMIIFCQPNYSEAVSAVRKECGLADRTEVITVENIYDIEPKLFERMKSAAVYSSAVDLSKNESF